MIASISGQIINKNPDSLVIEAGGIGYLVYVTSNVLVSVNVNDPIKLATHMIVREDMQALYGFLTLEELRLFSMLVSVSGVGPKMALAILNSGKPNELKLAISQDDIAIFTTISGVGQKTAARLILELKNKIEPSLDGSSSGDSAEIINALSSLGYNVYEIRQVIGQIPREGRLEEKIKNALKLLG